MAVLSSVVEFFKFGLGILLGIAKAITEDIDVFLLAVSAVLLSFSVTRWVGVVMLIFVCFRRMDEYMRALTTKADAIFRLMGDDSNQLHSGPKKRS